MECKNGIINLKLTKVQVASKSFLLFKYTVLADHFKNKKDLIRCHCDQGKGRNATYHSKSTNKKCNLIVDYACLNSLAIACSP